MEIYAEENGHFGENEGVWILKTLKQLEKMMTTPSDRLVEDMKKIDGDIMILGAGGKMGPSLAKLAKNAVAAAQLNKRVIAVSRFSANELRDELEAQGIDTIAADLLDEGNLDKLPNVKNIIYMVGMKFGTVGHAHYTWVMNSYLPGTVVQKFPNSRFVVFSTGNIYPLTPVKLGGSIETDPAAPIGEYAQTCLGRERIFQHYSIKNGTPVLIFRLNYAIDMRYGVLLDIAKSVYQEKPIDLKMGNVNVIWQGDANEYALRSLLHCASPANILNVTGPELLSVRRVAEAFGDRLKKQPIFVHEEEDTALLNNAGKCFRLFGYPSVTLYQMIDWISDWVKGNGITIAKPTHFQQREGAF